MDTTDRSRRVPRRTILLLVTVALLNVPAIAVATHVFRDVPDGFTHAPGIQYIAEAGITAGCTPATYCPNDGLTRGQMGSFLHRASGNAPGIPPTVNAATVTAAGIVTVQSIRTVGDTNLNTHLATCPAGTQVVGGGGFSHATDWRMEDSHPQGDNAWLVRYRIQSGTGNHTMTVYAVCLAVGQ